MLRKADSLQHDHRTDEALAELSVEALVGLIQDNDTREFAIVDVRDRRKRAEAGHLIHSVPLPLGQLEHEAPRLLPRRGALVVVVDEQGAAPARAAALRLQALGYQQVVVLTGGVNAWRQAGYEVYTGVCAYTKAFGEYVEHEYGTPFISAEALKAKLDGRENVLVVDGRSRAEFLEFSIPSAYSVPNAELPLRVPHLVSDDETLVVVNCAGRTRSIIGAQALINAGIRNPVVSLRNGTMDWLKLGFALQNDQVQDAPFPSETTLDQVRRSVASLDARFGIEWIDVERLQDLRRQRESLTLHVFDVRTQAEFEAGHLPGAQWVEGGELIQWLDHHLAVRNSHVVLVDDEEGARAAITASWLLQLNVAHVYALRTSAAQRSETSIPAQAAPETPAVAKWGAARLQQALQRNEAVLVDVSSSKDFVHAHIPGARWQSRAALVAPDPAADLAGRQLVLTSSDGTLAAWAAFDLLGVFPDVVVLEGGNQAWRRAGLGLAAGDPSLLRSAPDAAPSPYEGEDRFAAFDAYLEWEIELLTKVARDATVRYRKFPFPPSANVAAASASPARRGPPLPGDPEDPWNDLFRSIAQTAPARESSGKLPHDEVRALLARGFGALHLPREIGGAGLSYRELFSLIVRLAAADANIAHIFRNHYGFVNGLFSLEDQNKASHWLQRAARGELFANGVTDAVRPQDASGRVADLSRFSTRLVQDEKGTFVDGRKQYATGSVYADWLAIQATREDGSQTVTAVIASAKPGVEVIDDWAGFGQRFTASGTVVLDKVRIDDDVQILPRDKTRPGAEYSSSLPQLFLTAVIAGIVQASYDDALALLKTRKQNLYFAPTGTPTEDPLLLQTLGQLASNAFAARSIILHAAEAFDRVAALPLEQRSAANHAAALSAAQAKVAIDALGHTSATLLFDIAGASATHRDKQLDRHWRNARTISTHNPSLYKAMAIGAYLARGEPLPKQGFF